MCQPWSWEQEEKEQLVESVLSASLCLRSSAIGGLDAKFCDSGILRTETCVILVVACDMVCEKCEKKGKLGKVITPDPWKAGSRNSTESGGRKVGENKLLTAKKNRFNPLMSHDFPRCRICRSKVHQVGSHYCQECAYKKGICAMCGKKMINTKNYKQTSV